MDKWKKGTVLIVAHFIFFLVSSAFFLVFYEKNPDFPLHFLVFIGISFNVWAALHGTLDFIMKQARNVCAWFRGLNIVILGTTVFLCLFAMSQHKRVLLHLILVHISLSLYIIWDYFAIKYYKKNSTLWYKKYLWLFGYDLVLFCLFIPAYVPFLWQKATDAKAIKSSREMNLAFSDGCIAAVLIAELVIYTIWSWSHNRSDAEEILSVEEGYRKWASVYNEGNAVMQVERRHTNLRLSQLNLSGKLLDFGCGTGYYTEKLINHADKVYAIDMNEIMLSKLSSKLGQKPKLEIKRGNEAALRNFRNKTIDGILCTLVIDHLEKESLEHLFSEFKRIIKPKGWIYITDVNPYFEALKQPYAKFLDGRNKINKIKVIPHSIPFIIECIKRSKLGMPQINEIFVTDDDVKKWPELSCLAKVKFPLVTEFFIGKQ